jgi:hypothetical protein
MLNVIYAECCYAQCRYAQCHYAQCHYAECRYAECRYAECRGAVERYKDCSFEFDQFDPKFGKKHFQENWMKFEHT